MQASMKRVITSFSNSSIEIILQVKNFLSRISKLEISKPIIKICRLNLKKANLHPNGKFWSLSKAKSVDLF